MEITVPSTQQSGGSAPKKRTKPRKKTETGEEEGKPKSRARTTKPKVEKGNTSLFLKFIKVVFFALLLYVILFSGYYGHAGLFPQKSQIPTTPTTPLNQPQVEGHPQGIPQQPHFHPQGRCIHLNV